MSIYGIKVSKEGFDVKTADVADLVYSSEANQWKIYAKGTVSLSVPSGSGTYGQVDVSHSLGYPMVVDAGALYSGVMCMLPGTDQNGDYTFDMAIDSSKVRFYGRDASGIGARTFTISYVFYYERLDQ